MIFAASPARAQLDDVTFTRHRSDSARHSVLVHEWAVFWSEAKRAVERQRWAPRAAVALTPDAMRWFALRSLLERADPGTTARVARELQGVLRTEGAYAFMYVCATPAPAARAAKRLLVSTLEAFGHTVCVAAELDERAGIVGADFAPDHLEALSYAAPFAGLLETH